MNTIEVSKETDKQLELSLCTCHRLGEKVRELSKPDSLISWFRRWLPKQSPESIKKFEQHIPVSDHGTYDIGMIRLLRKHVHSAVVDKRDEKKIGPAQKVLKEAGVEFPSTEVIVSEARRRNEAFQRVTESIDRILAYKRPIE